MAEATIENESQVVGDLPIEFSADENKQPEIQEEEPEKKEEKKEKEAPDYSKEFSELKENYGRASKHIEDLNKAVSLLRRENKDLKSKKPDMDGESVFTDAQLLAILEENKDDPGVMLQAMKQLVKQGNLDTQKLTDKKVDLVKKQSEVDSVMTGWKDYIDKNQDTIEKVVDYHGLGDLPEWQRNHLALGAVLVAQWPKMVESIKEKAKEESLAGKADAARKNGIKANMPETKAEVSQSGEGGMLPSWVESANKLGLTGKARKSYFEMMKNSSKKKES